MNNPDQLHVSPETASLSEEKPGGLSGEEWGSFIQASQDLARHGFPRGEQQSIQAYAVSVMRTKEARAIVGDGNPLFEKLAKLGESDEHEAENNEEAEAALRALETVKKDSRADGWRTENELAKLAGLSPKEQAQALLTEYLKIGGEDAGLLDRGDVKSLRTLASGRLDSYIAKLEEKNEGLPQAV